MSQRIKATITTCLCAATVSLHGITLGEAAHSIAISSPITEASVVTMDASVRALAPMANLVNPEIEFEHLWGKPGNKMTIGVSQSFDWPGVYSQRSKVASSMRHQAIVENHLNYRQLLWQAEDLLTQAYYQQRSIDMLKVMLQNFERLNAAYQRSYEMGNGTKLDVKKIQIQQLYVNAMMDEYEVERTGIIGQLQQLNPTADINQLINSLTIITDDVPPLESLNCLYNPAITLAQAQSATARERVELQRRENLPSFNLGYRYNREIGDSFHGFAAAVALPLWGNRHKTQAAIAEFNASQVSLDATMKRTTAEMEQLWTTTNLLRGRLKAYHDVLDDTSILRLLDMALNGGEMTLMEYLQEVDFFIEAQIKMIATERDFQLSLNRLNRYAAPQPLIRH